MTILQKDWNGLIKPSSINVDYVDGSKNKAIITVEPLERGFGNTLGNSLRRILLSYIRGFAVTSVKIDGVLHEFSTIDGIREDVIDIIMNIKMLAIDKASSSSSVMTLKSKGKKGVLYARDIETGSGIEILNPDLVICHIEDENVDFNMQMTVEYGVGYSLSSDRNRSDKDISTIYLDTLFSPIKGVAYSVENARVGQKTDYDKLVLTVETNSTITPEDAVGLAAKILQDQLSSFISFDVVKENSAEREDETSKFGFNENLLKKIDDIELSVRSYNCLNSENIIYIADLVRKTENEMLRLPNFGRKSLNELKESLKAMGLEFGMNLDSIWDELSKELAKKK